MPRPVTTDAAARVGVLHLLSVSHRPVEGLQERVGERSPFLLKRPRVAEDFQRHAECTEVRAALGLVRASARTLGPRGYFALVENVYAADMARRVQRDSAWLRVAREDAARAREAGHDDPYLSGRAAEAQHDLQAAEALAKRQCAVSTRTYGPAPSRADRFLYRLRRDVHGPWEDVLGLFGEDVEYEAALAEAEALGFTLTEPLPASWVARVEVLPENEDEYDDQGEDEAPAAIAPDTEPGVQDDVADAAEPAKPFLFVVPPPRLAPVEDAPAIRRSKSQPVYVRETPEQARERLARQKAERERLQRLSPISIYGRPESEPRRWDCAQCGDSPRVYSAESPGRCRVCGGSRFS